MYRLAGRKGKKNVGGLLWKKQSWKITGQTTKYRSVLACIGRVLRMDEYEIQEGDTPKVFLNVFIIRVTPVI